MPLFIHGYGHRVGIKPTPTVWCILPEADKNPTDRHRRRRRAQHGCRDGTEAAPTLIAAAAGEEPVLSGGVALTGWLIGAPHKGMAAVERTEKGVVVRLEDGSGIELVEPEYFRTEHRWQQLLEARSASDAARD